MKRVTFPPASGGLIGTDERSCAVASCAAGAPAPFFPGKGCFRSLAVLLAVMAGFGSSRVLAEDRQQLKGHVPAVIGRLNLPSLGELPASNRVDLAIGLPLRDGAALDTLLQQIYDPGSANYHKYLTPEQFTQRFGPTQKDYQALIDFARAGGLEVKGQHSSRMLLDVEGAAADIEKAFQVKLRVYQHPSEKRTFFAPDVEPSVPAGLAVLDISGLNNYGRPHPHFVIKPKNLLQADGVRPNLGSGPGGNYIGYDFRDAYAPGVTLTGTGQTLALVEFDGFLASDIAIYDAQANLPNVPLQTVLLDGFNGAPTGTGGEVEVSLDIEMANSMAPGLSRIISYEGSPYNFFPNDVLIAIATDNSARQISCSWGWTGGPTATTDNIFKKMDAQGQTFFNASGDSDSLSTGEVDNPGLDWVPSDNPYITEVGATTLSTTGPLGSFVSETVWNWGGGIGSTGGISSYYAIPVWQQPVSMATNGGSTVFRNFPDVAAVGDNIYVVADNGTPYVGVGGTSCAAPLWAAFTSLANERAAQGGGSSLGFLNPAIYSLCLGPLYHNCLHDVTNGNNFSPVNPTEFTAVPGYDLCTGFGSMAGQPLINALVPTSGKAPVLVVLSNTISGGNGNGMIDPDECDNLNILVTNIGTGPATDVQGILRSLTPGVIIAKSTVSYPNIPAGGSGLNQTAFTVSTEPSFVCGTTVNLQFILKCDQTEQTNVLQLATGALGPPVRFDNTTVLPVPAGNLIGVFSPIAVSGINTIGKVTVSVYLTALEDEFMELQLLSPNGTAVMLAAGDGGVGANFGDSCTPDSSRTTFDDAATQSITTGLAPLVGTFSPVSPLAAFNLMTGTNVNGIWQLNVVNELTGLTATLQCWSLFITPEQCVDGGGQCPGADLSITMTANPITTPVGGPLGFALSVSNAGPSPGSNAVVSLTLPSSIVYQGAASSQGTISQLGSLVTFSLGTVAIQSNATMTVTTVPQTPGLFTATAVVGSPASTPESASASVLISRPAADLAVTMSVSPSSVPVNGQATFLINVTNNGPAQALGVTLTNRLPPNVNVISATVSQGSVSGGGTLASIGVLPVGSGATATLVLSPTVVGTSTLTSTAGLDPSDYDPVPGNNTATASINSVPAAQLGIAVAVSPSPAVSGANFAYVVTVTNSGPATATNVFMNQTLPGGVTFVSTSQSTAVDHNGVVTWTITNNMPSGTSLVLTNIVKAPTLLQGVGSNVLISTFTVFGQPSSPNTNNSYLVVSTTVLRPMVIITPLGDTLTSESYQPPNGAVNPGETVGVDFLLQNIGNIPTTNLVATLQTNGGVFPLAGHGQASYGALAPGGGFGTNQFMFSNNASDGGTIVATLQLQDGPTNLGTADFTFVMPVVSTFWKNEVVYIPGTNYVATNEASGPGGPYPSSNLVSGITTYVSGVTVTVSNLEHTFPHDISMLLVGPGGQSTVLMSAAANYSSAAIPVTITFDDNASTPAPAIGSLVSGSYQPSQYNAPVFTNVPNILSPYNTNLSVFAGTPANGWWYLYAYDGRVGDYGAISNGWGLAITTITPVNLITDVGVAIAASSNQVMLGGDVAYTITVTNLGTNAATVFLTNVLGAGLSFVSNTIPAYTPYQQIGQAQYYNLGLLAGQTNLIVGFVANATAAGLQTSTASIGSSLIDPNTNNNVAAAAVTVVLPAADVAAAISSSAGAVPVVVGSNVVYTLTVTNNGPNTALNVSGVLTQGVTGQVSAVFTNSFGNISPGFIATALFSNATAVAGLLTNTWTVSTGSTDTNLADNAATLVLAVTYPEPFIVTNGVKLLAESFLPPNGAIDSNETVTVAFTLKNIGVAATTNLTATLLSGNGVTPVTASQNYGVISPGASAAQSFTFTGRGVPGSTITAVLSLMDNAYSLGTVSFPFIVTTPLSFANTAQIIILDSSPATPYPAVIAVATTNGVIGQVTASLQGFTHTFPQDVNVLLVSPSGLQTVLMAHAGGSYSVSNVVLAFDDGVTNTLTEAALVSGTNHPGQIPPLDSFPGISGQPSNTNLSIFNGGDPNGVWSLYVFDDTLGNAGNIANGWTLGLVMVNPINPPGSLGVAMSLAPSPVYAGNYLTCQITVTNLGPSGATNVLLTDTLPATAGLIAAAASQGTVNTNVPGFVTFSLGDLVNAGATATATLQLQPLQPGSVFNSAYVTNAAGSAASASNTVIVLNSVPTLQATYLTNNLRLTLSGYPEQNYIMQVSTNLITWTSVSTNVSSATGLLTLTNSLTNGQEQFYRALHLPQ
ncbi:MAG: protease pro-enzyme activation domain-containing protein [Verrucomicrobiota bacterium]|jgi:uncharacterized repeat protein (TIGR01451 family)